MNFIWKRLWQYKNVSNRIICFNLFCNFIEFCLLHKFKVLSCVSPVCSLRVKLWHSVVEPVPRINQILKRKLGVDDAR